MGGQQRQFFRGGFAPLVTGWLAGWVGKAPLSRRVFSLNVSVLHVFDPSASLYCVCVCVSSRCCTIRSPLISTPSDRPPFPASQPAAVPTAAAAAAASSLVTPQHLPDVNAINWEFTVFKNQAEVTGEGGRCVQGAGQI